MSKRMAKNRRNRPNHDTSAPLYHENHKRPVTRREFLGQGMIAGSAIITAPTILSLMSAKARAASPSDCGLGLGGAGKIPFICFDLGGGANMTGSNILVGGPGGQLDPLSNGGYSKLGLPGDQLPTDPAFVNTDFGLAMHSDSAFLRGMLAKTTVATRANTNGAVIPARSDNDTQNNPHNPMYGIAKAGAKGELLELIGTRNSDSGGRSMAPAALIDLTKRPTKVDRPSDATGLVDTGELGTMMPSTEEAGAVMQAIEEVSFARLSSAGDALDNTSDIDPSKAGYTIQDNTHCGYLKTTDTVTNFGDISAFDPLQDNNIVNAAAATQPTEFSNTDTAAAVAAGIPDVNTPIFTSNELNNGKYTRTVSVMKLVTNGLAGAGTVEFGGYDYHNGTRATGERRDYEVGQAIGAVLEYAARARSGAGIPIMVYVFTDGSLASNGRLDGSADGRGKGEWTGDNSSTSAGFFMVYNPGGRATLMGGTLAEQATHQQLGHFRSSASVETTGTTPGANNVNQLVDMVLLNYMALHGETGLFDATFPNHGLGASSSFDNWTAFTPIVSGTIT